MVADVRRVAATLDLHDLAGELAARPGSMLISMTELANIELSRRFDQSLNLRLTDGSRTHRFQFDHDRRDEVKAFTAALSAASERDVLDAVDSIDHDGKRSRLSFEQNLIETVEMPPPCWGATPHVSVADGRLFVDYIAPTGIGHGEMSVVYRSTDAEQDDFAAGRIDLPELCQRLVRTAWGTKPPARDDGTAGEEIGTQRAAERRKLERSLATCRARLDETRQNLGRGGSAEQTSRLDLERELEIKRVTLERQLGKLAELDD